jgi:hypothetical protein
MYCVDGGVGSTQAPKLLGTYEKELLPVVEELVSMSPQTVIDIGAAEGYYAVGIARALPGTQVIAFEADAVNRTLLEKMSDRNGVYGRVSIHGACNAEKLGRILADTGPSWIVVDIEGAEREVLDPEQVPPLAGCHLLVEILDTISPGIGELISRRFQATHTQQEISQQPRRLVDFPVSRNGILSFTPAWILEKAMDEKRASLMRWFYLKPR